MFWFIAFTFLELASTAIAAVIVGTLTDASGKPLENVRIDHTGKMVVVAATRLGVKPSPDETRTDVAGHFRAVTDAPAIVVRLPGYESQRLRVDGDAQVRITLQRIISTSRCKLSTPPVFKTKGANDVDYTAAWFYVETAVNHQWSRPYVFVGRSSRQRRVDVSRIHRDHVRERNSRCIRPFFRR